jgi:prepilin-type N-terminal cleavage/methylation domain-containing protein
MRAHRRRAGFTLIELLISMVVLSIVLGGTTMTLLRVQQQYTAQRATIEARDQARFLEMILTNLFRTAGANPMRITPASNVAMVVNPLGRSGTSWNNVDIRADFNPVDGTLDGELENVRVALTSDTVYIRLNVATTPEPIAYPVSELRFQFYALDGTEITNATTVPTSARRVRISIAVPTKQSSNVIRREIWIALRN